MSIDLSRLREPFPADHVEWRVGRCGMKGDKPWCMVLAYLTNRAIQDRLDEVVGPGNWQDDYRVIDGGFLCGIGIKIDGAWVWKWDGADKTDIEAIKGGLSGAEKRAAVKWGIGRYLYGLEEGFAETSTERQQGWNMGETKEKQRFWWKPPQLPAWALPSKKPTPPKADPPKQPEPCAEYLHLRASLRDIGCTNAAHANAVLGVIAPTLGKDIAALVHCSDECRQLAEVITAGIVSGDMPATRIRELAGITKETA